MGYGAVSAGWNLMRFVMRGSRQSAQIIRQGDTANSQSSRSDAGWNKTDGAPVSNGMAAANLPTDLERRSLPVAGSFSLVERLALTLAST